MELGSSCRACSSNALRSRVFLGTHRLDPQRPRAQNEVERVRIGRPLPLAAGGFEIRQCHVQGPTDSPDNLLLAGAEIVQLLIEAVRPKMRAVSVAMSCAFTRSVSPSLRTLPSRT